MKASALEIEQMKETGLSLNKVRHYCKQPSYTKKGSGRVAVQGKRAMHNHVDKALQLQQIV